jgi:SET domain-containing protein
MAGLGTVVQMSKLACQPSPLHGRGLFVTKSVRAGEVLDSGPLLLVPNDELNDTLIGWYVFEFDDEHCALCLGKASMLNHSTAANAEVVFDKEALTYEVLALESLVAGVELMIDYGSDYGL